MKKIVLIAALFALSFATGFTCSKNAPEQTATVHESATTTSTTDTQAQMAVSNDQTMASSDTSMAQPATEPTTETK